MDNGIITKNSLSVLGGMNYSIKSAASRDGLIRIKDINTGEIYLSETLSQKFTDPALNFTFPKDAQVSIQLTAPVRDVKLFRLCITLTGSSLNDTN